MPILLTVPESGIFLIKLQNPPANALGRAMRLEFLERLAQVDADPAARVVIVTGDGKAFCAGDDLKEAESRVPGDMSDFEAFDRVYDGLEAFRLPVIAAVNGPAFGGGLELALCSDIRIASRSATFACSAVNIGLLASAWRLPRLIGEGAAKAMLLTGETVSAQRAMDLHLITSVHEPEDLEDAALALARRIATRAPMSVEAAKRLAGLSFSLTADEARAANSQALAQLVHSQDHQEAIAAFLGRRDPQFHRR
jgi:enoyl-CoA hydratase